MKAGADEDDDDDDAQSTLTRPHNPASDLEIDLESDGDGDGDGDGDSGSDANLTTDPSAVTRTIGALAVRRRNAPAASRRDRYMISGELGAGAMGIVELCNDEWVGRDVARKRMNPAKLGTDWIRERFEREVRVQGQLEHPAIVPVYDVEPSADGLGLDSFTMRRVQGSSLRDIIRSFKKAKKVRRKDSASSATDVLQRHNLRRRLGAFATVCLAVAYAHRRGVVHRDIKPSNLMLGDFGEVYVLDWGVARVIGDDSHEQQRDRPRETRESSPPSVVVPRLSVETEVGDMIGTLGYMAPEQARGEPAGPACDVYALGATLFELLTLQRLHASTPNEVLRELNAGVEARPSVRAPELAIPLELEDLCVRATATDPDARPKAQDIHDAIETFLDGQRDHERRRELANEHIARARHALREPSNGARDVALREISTSLGLDPGNAGAIQMLQEVLHAPVADADSEEGRDALLEIGRVMRQVVAQSSLVLMIFWAGAILAIATLGVRTWIPVIAALVTLVLTGVFLASNTTIHNAVRAWGVVIAANLSAGITAAAFGPFVILPGILTFVAMTTTIVIEPSEWQKRFEPNLRFLREGTLLTGPLTFLGALALELSGVVPPSIAFRDNTIILLPRVNDFPPVATLIYLTVVNLFLIAGPSVIILRYRSYTFAIERRAFAIAERLRGFVPEEARGAGTNVATPRSRTQK